jgi:hypothetical protein
MIDRLSLAGALWVFSDATCAAMLADAEAIMRDAAAAANDVPEEYGAEATAYVDLLLEERAKRGGVFKLEGDGTISNTPTPSRETH